MRNFQDIIFLRVRKYKAIFKSALVSLQKSWRSRPQPAILLKIRDFGTGVFLRILRNF